MKPNKMITIAVNLFPKAHAFYHLTGKPSDVLWCVDSHLTYDLKGLPSEPSQVP